MRTETFSCDRCGEPAAERVRVTEGACAGQGRLEAHDMTELDLCPRCAAELRAWMEKREA